LRLVGRGAEEVKREWIGGAHGNSCTFGAPALGAFPKAAVPLPDLFSNQAVIVRGRCLDGPRARVDHLQHPF